MSRTPPTIDEAMTDPNLLAAALGDLESWSTWRVVIKAAFALPLTDDERKIFDTISGGREPPTEPVKELWAIVGRRAGKSRVAALIMSYVASLLRHKLSAGEIGYALSLSASKSQAASVREYARAFLDGSPILRQQVVDANAEEIKLKGNLAIAAHTNSFRTVRGRTLIVAVFDEVAFWNEEGALPDKEVYRAILPALATTGGMLVGISSPYRRAGLLFAKHEKAFGKNDPSVLVVKAPTQLFNPTLDADVIRRDMEADPEAARSEWMAEFRNDIADFLDRKAIEQCIEVGVRERPPNREKQYVGFCDPSGGASDAMTLGIAHKEGVTAVLDALREVRPPFNPEAVVAEFSDLLRSYRISTVSGDRYAGEWVASQFRKCRVHYSASESSKSDLYRDLLPIVNSGAASLIENERMVSQLVSLERRTARGGKDSIDHPPNGHDDVANAAAGALVNALQDTRGAFASGPYYTVAPVDPLAEFHAEPRSRNMSAAASDPLAGF